MSAEVGRPAISRVLMELGTVTDGEEMIDIACTLAAAVHAELYGLFVEDEALTDLSGLPFAHAVAPGRPAAQPINPENLARAYRQRATACRSAISARAGGARIAWAFDTARGRGSAELRARTAATDLVVVQQHALGQSARDLVEAARAAASAACAVAVIGRRTRRSDGPVIAIDDGDEAGVATVDLASRLARKLGAPVELCIVAPDEAAARQAEERDLRIIGEVPVTVRRFPGRPDDLEAVLAAANARFVVGDLEGEPFGDSERGARLVRAARAPIVLIRRAARSQSSSDT